MIYYVMTLFIYDISILKELWLGKLTRYYRINVLID